MTAQPEPTAEQRAPSVEQAGGQPEILARGPWPLEQVSARWSAQHFEPSAAHAAAADEAITALRERGSPSHDGLAGRLVDARVHDGALELELQPCAGRCGWSPAMPPAASPRCA